MLHPTSFFWIAASVADRAVVSPNGIKRLLANALSTFFINGKSVFSNGSRSLLRNDPYCTILDNWVFDKVILTNEPFGKALRIFKPCILVNNNLWGKLVA